MSTSLGRANREVYQVVTTAHWRGPSDNPAFHTTSWWKSEEATRCDKSRLCSFEATDCNRGVLTWHCVSLVATMSIDDSDSIYSNWKDEMMRFELEVIR